MLISLGVEGLSAGAVVRKHSSGRLAEEWLGLRRKLLLCRTLSFPESYPKALWRGPLPVRSGVDLHTEMSEKCVCFELSLPLFQVSVCQGEGQAWQRVPHSALPRALRPERGLQRLLPEMPSKCHVCEPGTSVARGGTRVL